MVFGVKKILSVEISNLDIALEFIHILQFILRCAEYPHLSAFRAIRALWSGCVRQGSGQIDREYLPGVVEFFTTM